MTIQFIASADFWKHRTCLWRMAALKYYRLAKQSMCGWCGYTGPREKVAEHIMECVEHPMGELAWQWLAEKTADAKRIVELEAKNAALRAVLPIAAPEAGDLREADRMREALEEYQKFNPIHNDLEAYLFDYGEWALGRSELDKRPDKKAFGIQ